MVRVPFFYKRCKMSEDALIAQILIQTKVIALVGWSPKPDRPSHRVAAYLAARGYRVLAVNPGQAGVVTAWGEVVRATLSDIAEPVDMVDIFRAPAEVGAVVDEAITQLSGPRVIWMQLGVVNEAAAQTARAAGLTVVMNRCPAIEIPRLGL
jgi:predicted CoA-binding protein